MHQGFEYCIRYFQTNGLQLNVTHRRLIYAEDINLLGENTNIKVLKKWKAAQLDAGKHVGLEIHLQNTLSTWSCLVTRLQHKTWAKMVTSPTPCIFEHVLLQNTPNL